MKLINPVFFERTPNGETFYDIHARLIKDRIIFLCEELTDEAASIITALLFTLDSEDKTKKISLWLNSPGGSVNGLLAIYDMMQLISAPIETFCIGEASSAAAVLLSAGTPGMRYATEHSTIMIHEVRSGVPFSPQTDIEIEAAEIRHNKELLNKIIAKHTGQPLAKVITDCERNKYMTAHDALKYGVIDKVLVGKTKPPAEGFVEAKKPGTKKVSKKTTKKGKS